MINVFSNIENPFKKENYEVGRMFLTQKWYVRPLHWKGEWKVVNGKKYLLSGNVFSIHNTKSEADKVVRALHRKNCGY